MATIPLTQSNPELCREWHPTLNGDLTPDKVSAGSHKKVWWLGKCGHEWESEIASRTLGRGCGYCSGNKVLKGFNDLQTKFPKIAREWHPTLNGDLKPSEVISGSRDKAWWLGDCGHEWEASIGSRTKMNRGCGYCSGNFVLDGFNDLATTHPELTQEWHPTLNGDLTPSQFSFGSSKTKVWWLGKCGHEWEGSVASRIRSNCPFCSGNLVLKGFNDLESRYPELAKEWHDSKNGDLLPSAITFGSNKVIWWLGKCGHEWEGILGNRVRGAGCSICAGKEVLAGFNDLASKCPELLDEWDYSKNSHLDPTKLTAGSRVGVWWIGKCGHKWNSSITNRSISGAGCPKCSPGGFSSSEPGFIYFIQNQKLMAFKVGISNPTAIRNRLEMFSRQGWSVIKTWDSESGLTILNVETKFFKWLRKDKQIPRYLSKSDMGNAQGHSETFSDSILTQAEVIAKIEELLRDNS
jgi:hypothetical protein